MKKIIFTTAILVASAGSAYADNMKYNLKVEGMYCQTCATSSKKAMMKIEGVKSVEVDVKAGNVAVCAAPGTKLADADLKQVFLQKGLSYKSKKEAGTC